MSKKLFVFEIIERKYVDVGVLAEDWEEAKKIKGEHYREVQKELDRFDGDWDILDEEDIELKDCKVYSNGDIETPYGHFPIILNKEEAE